MLRGTFACLLVVALLAPATSAEWASFRGDSRNTGSVFGSTYPVYSDVWWNVKAPNNAQIKASPVLKDQILIVADIGGVATDERGRTSVIDGLVRALDAESGKELWNHTMTGAVYSTPAISGERVYVADIKGVLRALNLRDGHVEHEITGHGATQAPITLHEGKLFLGTEAGEMKAYLASTLTPLWTFKTSDAGNYLSGGGATCNAKHSAQAIRSGAAVFDGKVFFGSLNHRIYAVDEEGQGDLKTRIMWFHKTSDIVVATPAINIQSSTVARVVVGSYDGKMYSFDPSPTMEGTNTCSGLGQNITATPAWTPFQVPSLVDTSSGEVQVSKIQSSAAVQGNRIYFGANNGHVYALDATNGAKIWNQTAGSFLTPVTSSPVVANGKVVVGSENKNVYWLNATNGQQLARYETQGAIQTSPAIDGVRAFVASQDGVTYMFGPAFPERPDLSVTSITATPTSVQVVITNERDDRGKGLASVPSTLRLQADGNDLATLDVPAIGPDQSYTVTYDGPVPLGRVNMVAIADFGSSNAESDESNNQLSKSVTVEDAVDSETDGGDGGGGGLKIPSPGVVPLLAVLALALLALRRRQ